MVFLGISPPFHLSPSAFPKTATSLGREASPHRRHRHVDCSPSLREALTVRFLKVFRSFCVLFWGDGSPAKTRRDSMELPAAVVIMEKTLETPTWRVRPSMSRAGTSVKTVSHRCLSRCACSRCFCLLLVHAGLCSEGSLWETQMLSEDKVESSFSEKHLEKA